MNGSIKLTKKQLEEFDEQEVFNMKGFIYILFGGERLGDMGFHITDISILDRKDAEKMIEQGFNEITLLVEQEVEQKDLTPVEEMLVIQKAFEIFEKKVVSHFLKS